MPPPDLPAALVLAGGRARRMGGIDKLAVSLAGVTVLDRVLAAAAAVSRAVVVVGPARPTGVAGVTFVVEDEPGGGPVPAVKAGLAVVGDGPLVLVLAADLPLLAAEHLRQLLQPLEADPTLDAVAAADDTGRPNPLLAAYRTPALRAAAERLGTGHAAAGLLPEGVDLVDLGPVATLNVNRPADLERARALLGEPGPEGGPLR
jgi:molybdopterin-guanine dinucleotide biosynthesis protein A